METQTEWHPAYKGQIRQTAAGSPPPFVSPMPDLGMTAAGSPPPKVEFELESKTIVHGELRPRHWVFISKLLKPFGINL